MTSHTSLLLDLEEYHDRPLDCATQPLPLADLRGPQEIQVLLLVRVSGFRRQASVGDTRRLERRVGGIQRYLRESYLFVPSTAVTQCDTIVALRHRRLPPLRAPRILPRPPESRLR